MPAWVVATLLVTLLLTVIAVAVAAARTRARTARDLDAAHRKAEALRRRVEEIEHRLALPARAEDRQPTEFVITRLGDEAEVHDQPAPVVGAPLFADLVLRESVVQAASFAHGIRRALAPETRNRIRFEMRREVRASRKRRRRELKQLATRVRAAERGALREEGSAA